MIRVLLVEDNQIDAKQAKEMLAQASKEQIEVTHVERFSTALKRLSRDHYDAIMLDMALLDTHGLDPFSQVLPSIASLPIVLLASRINEPLAMQALQHGAQDYLVKGQWTSEQLTRSIQHAIKRKQAEQSLTYLAQYDYLTALANRTLFRDRLAQALARSKRSGRPLCLMRIGLDRFRMINDTVGSEKGDALLKTAAIRLKACQREVDTVARLWGDEFTILLEDLATDGDYAIVARRILGAIAQPFDLDGHEVSVTASLGITIYPADNSTLDDLLKHAGMAMESAKEQGGNCYQFYATGPV